LKMEILRRNHGGTEDTEGHGENFE